MPAPGSRFLAVLTGLTLSLVVTGPVCNESLPPYADPRQVFEGSIEGGYVLTMSDNSVKIYLMATNRFDETFEGRATLRGEIQISHATNPSITKTFSISSANLFTTSNYNSSTEVLRVDPGETVKFGVSWNLVDDGGLNLRTALFRYWKDLDCTSRCIAEEERFVMTGYVDVFDKTERVFAGPSTFSLCHVNVYVEPRFCPPIDFATPCSKRAVTTGLDAERCP